MYNILFINACARPESRTKELAEHLLQRLSGNVQHVNLYDIELSPLDYKALEQREKDCHTLDFSAPRYNLAKQFASADTIVIAAPYWDLLFPAVLRTYLEAVSVSGISFKYSPEGHPIGLCRAKKLYYVTTAGGFIGDCNFGFSYISALAQNLFGIEHTECFSAEGLDVFIDKIDFIIKQTKEKVDKNYEI